MKTCLKTEACGAQWNQVMDDRRIKASAHQRPPSSKACTSWYMGNDRMKMFPRKSWNLYGTENVNLLIAEHSSPVCLRVRGHTVSGKFVMCEQNRMIYSSEIRLMHIGTEGVLFIDHIKNYSCHYFMVVVWHWPIGTLLPNKDKL